MEDIKELPQSLEKIRNGDATELLVELNERFQSIQDNFSRLTGSAGTGPAVRTYAGGLNTSNPYSYVNPIVNVYEFLDPLYAKLRTAALQVREINMLSNSVGQNQLQIDSVVARHIVANTITADKLFVSELSAITGNIGSITAGNITLDNAGFIRGGSTSYTAGTGFWMGYDGGAYKFFLGSHAGDFLQWDGANLTIAGSAAIVGSVDWTSQVTNRPLNNTGLVITNAVPAVAGLFLGSNYMGYYNGTVWKTYMDSAGAFYLGGTSGALQWNGTTLAIANTSITGLGSLATASSVDWTTNVTSRPVQLTDSRITTALNSSGLVISGVVPGINVTTGGAGLYLGANFMGYYNGSTWKTYMDNTGNFYLGGISGALTWNGTTLNIVGGGTFSGALSAATGTFSGALSAATGSFAGSLSAATGTFAGTLNAAGGSFTGSLTAATGTFAGALSAATGTFAGTLSAVGGTFTGALSAATGSFSGSLSAATGSFSGAITSTSGSIAGFTINATSLTGTNFTLNQQQLIYGSTSGPRIILDITSGTAPSIQGSYNNIPAFQLTSASSTAYGSLQLYGASNKYILLDSSNSFPYQLYDGSTQVFTVNYSGDLKAGGYICRAGTAGSHSGNRFNFFWNGSAVEMYIDNTFIKNL